MVKKKEILINPDSTYLIFLKWVPETYIFFLGLRDHFEILSVLIERCDVCKHLKELPLYTFLYLKIIKT